MSNVTSKIKTRETRNGLIRTEPNRDYDSDMTFAATTLPENNSTALFIRSDMNSVRLTGRQARTLYRVLQKHYKNTGKTW